MRFKSFLLLSYLRDHQAATQQELEGALLADANAVVLLLNELEAARWSIRRRDPDDRRRHLVEMTAAGRQALERAEQARENLEEEILPTLRELGIGLVPYSPLGRGFLTGRFQSPDDFPEGDFRRNNPRFQGENFYANLRLVERVKELAREHDCTPGQLALAWVLHQGRDVVPIPGTKRRAYLEENVAATEITLSEEDLRVLDDAAPVGATAGDRYPDMSGVNR